MWRSTSDEACLTCLRSCSYLRDGWILARLDELGTATDVYGLLDDLGNPKVPVGTQPGPQFGCAGWLGLCVANCSFVVAGVWLVRLSVVGVVVW